MNLRSFLAVCCTSVIFPVWAGFIPEASRDAMVKDIFEHHFWSHAVLSDGRPVQPLSEKDRTTLPVSRSTAGIVIDTGEISGLAEWCGLDWQSHYLSMTAAARKSGLKERQMAFVGVLHGVTQGAIYKSMKSEPCGASKKSKVLELMRSSSQKTF